MSPDFSKAMVLTALFMLLPVAFGQPASPASDEKPAPGFATRHPRYQLRAMDVIDLAFAPAAEFNQTVSVQPDGYISLKDIGDLHVQGKTVPELTKMASEAYSRILHNPVITITLKDFAKPQFTVDGQVGKPGRYDLRSDTTVTEALAIAGGVNEKAHRKQVLVFRRVSDEWVEVRQFDLKHLYKTGLREDLHLRAGDMIFVPQNRLSKLKPLLPVWSLGTYLGVTPRF